MLFRVCLAVTIAADSYQIKEQFVADMPIILVVDLGRRRDQAPLANSTCPSQYTLSLNLPFRRSQILGVLQSCDMPHAFADSAHAPLFFQVSLRQRALCSFPPLRESVFQGAVEIPEIVVTRLAFHRSTNLSPAIETLMNDR